MMVYPVTASVFLDCIVVFTEKACKCREVPLMDVSMDRLECILLMMVYPVTASVFLDCIVVFTEKARKCRGVLLIDVSMDRLLLLLCLLDCIVVF